MLFAGMVLFAAVVALGSAFVVMLSLAEVAQAAPYVRWLRTSRRP
jgi:hypothetical protein